MKLQFDADDIRSAVAAAANQMPGVTATPEDVVIATGDGSALLGVYATVAVGEDKPARKPRKARKPRTEPAAPGVDTMADDTTDGPRIPLQATHRGRKARKGPVMENMANCKAAM